MEKLKKLDEIYSQIKENRKISEEKEAEKNKHGETSVCYGCHVGDTHPSIDNDAYLIDENGNVTDTLHMEPNGKVDTMHVNKPKNK
jgi:hypothetical protein